MKKLRITGYFFILPFVLVLALFSQTTGTLSGTVNNASGAVVPNATVTVTPVGGGSSQKVLADQDGKFAITGLPPGMYVVEVEFAGYKRTSIQNLDLTAGTPASVTVQLQTGDTRETVEVQGHAVLIQTDNGQTSSGLDTRNLTDTPIFDRNHQELVNLTPGVTPPYTTAPNVVIDPQQNRYWEANGLSNGTNRRMLDGVENGEPFNGGGIFVSPVQAVQQMNLITSNFDALSGRAGGSILSPVTRKGTNDFHGSLFEFNSNNAMSARNFFNPKGYPQARFTINQTGASFGGPIRSDSTFFFVDFEADLNRSQVPTLSTVPTAAMLAGNFSAVPGLVLYNPASGLSSGANRSVFANNIIPANLITTQARAIGRFFPAPNSDGFNLNLAVNTPLRNDGYRGDVRFDHKVHDGLNLFARWSYADYITDQSSPLGILFGSDGHLQNHNAMIGMTQAMSPSMIMDLRLNYNRYADRLNNSATGISPAALGFSDPNAALFANAGFTNLGLPQIQIGGMQTFGTTAGYPQYNTENNFNLVNSWNKLIGRNNIHFGFDVYWIRANGFQNLAFGPEGGFAFGPGATASPAGAGLGPYGDFANSFASFLVGAPSQAGRNLPVWNPGYSSWQASAYLADTVKITDRLTLDIGAHYDVFTPPAPQRSNAAFIFDPFTNRLLPTNTGSVNNVGNFQTNWNNIAPRIGFAFRPMGGTVIRGGYGINYFQGPLNFYAGAYNSNFGLATGGMPGAFTVAGNFNSLPSVTSLLAAGATGPIPAPNTTLVFSPTNMKTPYVQTFDFQIQHDVGHYGLVGTIGYVGNLGRELPYSVEANASQPGRGVLGEPFAIFNRTASTIQRGTGLTSNYNSLQANLAKRFSNNLSFTLAYTYSRALDDGPGGLTPLLNGSNFKANYGPADWNRTHMFTLSHVWRLPFGAGTGHMSDGVIGRILGPWQLNGVFSWVSGTPFTITADPTLCNCPGNTAIASTVVTGTSTRFVPVPTFFGFLPVPVQSLDFAFTQPAANTAGNLGRNSVNGEGFANYNLSLFRSFVIHDQVRLEFRGEAYNLANTPHFSNPIANVNSVNFGQSISTLPYDPERRLQVALRLLF